MKWRTVVFLLGLLAVVGATIYLAKYSGGGFMKKSEVENADAVAEWQVLTAREDLAVATFAGGCFWCMEGPFESLDGVEEVISGYSGGSVENPSYEEVISGKTGHRESVQIFYDPEQVSYQQLLDIYWLQIDPTDPGGQFADRGEQYKTAIYVHNDEQRTIAQESLSNLADSGIHNGKIVTEIIPFESFYPAEDHHQDFYKHSAERYERYKKGSGRGDFIEKVQEAINGEVKESD